MTLYITGAILEETYTAVMEFLASAGGKSVKVVINSGGGEHMDSLAIYSALRHYQGEVTTVAIGQVQSAAVLIFAAGDARYAHEDCWFMVHEDTGKLHGTVTELKTETAQLLRLESHWAKLMQDRTGEDAGNWAQLSNETTYLDSKEAHELGLVHRILKGKP